MQVTICSLKYVVYCLSFMKHMQIVSNFLETKQFGKRR